MNLNLTSLKFSSFVEWIQYLSQRLMTVRVKMMIHGSLSTVKIVLPLPIFFSFFPPNVVFNVVHSFKQVVAWRNIWGLHFHGVCFSMNNGYFAPFILKLLPNSGVGGFILAQCMQPSIYPSIQSLLLAVLLAHKLRTVIYSNYEIVCII